MLRAWVIGIAWLGCLDTSILGRKNFEQMPGNVLQSLVNMHNLEFREGFK